MTAFRTTTSALALLFALAAPVYAESMASHESHVGDNGASAQGGSDGNLGYVENGMTDEDYDRNAALDDAGVPDESVDSCEGGCEEPTTPPEGVSEDFGADGAN